jgi:hypothetical protein
MPVPRHQIPILIVARFLSRLPRYTDRDARRSLFSPHQEAIALDISGEDRGEPSFD